ncbi:MAG TPA: hypothetical protein VGS96_21820 [Thermoanaerobaculia bacterium]|jgi:hypothetical protein|nr:hypothetical protein [Thermoanaerobaculia bacterium]
MNARWIARIIGILMLIGFIMLLANLQRRLIEIRQTRRPAPTSTR